MRKFLVGGAVRDIQLGLKPQDHDYLVLDVTAAELLASGYLSVGNDFTVFLHPESREQYALPRGDTLEEDLKRRDLTINAMAMSETGELIDPFGGKQDLEQGRLRHVSDFFAEDPVRVLRVARFHARWPRFHIAPETEKLLQELAGSRRLVGLTKERVLREMTLALEAPTAALFFEDLIQWGAFPQVFPDLKEFASGIPDSVRRAETGASALQKFCFLAHHLPQENILALGKDLGLSREWREASRAASLYGKKELLDFFYVIDAYRKPELIDLMLPLRPDISAWVRTNFALTRQVSILDVPSGLEGAEIAEAIRKKREEILIPR